MDVDDDDNAKIFPQRLMEILNDPTNHDSIAWLPHGKAFAITNRYKFANEVLPKYFRKSKYTSFTRKLNRWNFSRVTKGPEMGSYYHEYFRRGNEALCTQMYCKNERAKFAISKAKSDESTTTKDDSNNNHDNDEDDDEDEMQEIPSVLSPSPPDSLTLQQKSLLMSPSHLPPLPQLQAPQQHQQQATMARQGHSIALGQPNVPYNRTQTNAAPARLSTQDLLSSVTAATNHRPRNDPREQARQLLLQVKQLLRDSGTSEISRSLVEIALKTLDLPQNSSAPNDETRSPEAIFLNLAAVQQQQQQQQQQQLSEQQQKSLLHSYRASAA